MQAHTSWQDKESLQFLIDHYDFKSTWWCQVWQDHNVIEVDHSIIRIFQYKLQWQLRYKSWRSSEGQVKIIKNNYQL